MCARVPLLGGGDGQRFLRSVRGSVRRSVHRPTVGIGATGVDQRATRAPFGGGSLTSSPQCIGLKATIAVAWCVGLALVLTAFRPWVREKTTGSSPAVA